VQEAFELEKEQHYRHSQEREEEYGVGLPMELDVLSNCFGHERPRLEGLSAMRT
jgi:hypothetical protein